MLSLTIKDLLISFYFGEISKSDFYKGIVQTDFEKIVGESDYLQLFEVDSRSLKLAIKHIYIKQVSKEIEVDKALNTAKGVVSGLISIDKGVQILCTMNSNGISIIPDVFVGYYSEIERLGSNEFYKDRIISDLESLILSLEEI